MHGIQQGLMAAGRNAGRALELGSHYSGLEIACFVLGVVLWAAVMTTLVLGMIALVKHLKKSKNETSYKSDKAAK